MSLALWEKTDKQGPKLQNSVIFNSTLRICLRHCTELKCVFVSTAFGYTRYCSASYQYNNTVVYTVKTIFVRRKNRYLTFLKSKNLQQTEKMQEVVIFLPMFVWFLFIHIYSTLPGGNCNISHEHNISSLQSEILHTDNFRLFGHDQCKSLRDCKKQKPLTQGLYQTPTSKNMVKCISRETSEKNKRLNQKLTSWPVSHLQVH